MPKFEIKEYFESWVSYEVEADTAEEAMTLHLDMKSRRTGDGDNELSDREIEMIE